MLDPVEFLASMGFKSLANRTLDLLSSSMPGLGGYFGYRDLVTLSDFSANLAKVNEHGEINSIGENGQANLAEVIGLLDTAIPPQFKPVDDTTCRELAISAICSYYNIPDLEEFVRRTGINSLQEYMQQSTGQEFSLAETLDGQGKINRTFYSFFDSHRPAYSALVNVHNLNYALQPEQNEISEIYQNLKRITGIDKLIDAIMADKSLSQKRRDFVMASHGLNFFMLPRMLQKARQVGADAEQLKAFLTKNVPLMNFLTCYSAGAAYVRQADIIGSAPALQAHQAPLQMYRLLALTDALLAPFLEPRYTVNRLGIGLFEHFAKNPGVGNVLRSSSEFHSNLTADHFQVQAYL